MSLKEVKAMNSVTRLELKKLNNKKTYLIGSIFLVVIIVLMLIRSTTDIVDENGEFLSGIRGWKILKEQGITSDGFVTVDYMKREREKYQNSINKPYVEGVQSEDRDLGLKLQHPQDLLFWELNFPYRNFGTPYGDMNLTDEEIENFYEHWYLSVGRLLRETESNYDDEQIEAIINKARDVEAPFYYEYNRGWHLLIYQIERTFYVFLIYIAFILCDLLAKDSESGIEQIALSTKESRKSLFTKKLHAAEIFSTIAYLCYVGTLFIYHGMIYSLHGGSASVQFLEGLYIFSLTTWQAVFIKIIVGYFATIVITHLILFMSAMIKKGKVVLFICGIYIYFVHDYGASISSWIQRLMYFMPQGFIHQVLAIRKLTVVGSFVIPYAAMAIFLSLVYMLILRIAGKIVMKHYYIS